MDLTPLIAQCRAAVSPALTILVSVCLLCLSPCLALTPFEEKRELLEDLCRAMIERDRLPLEPQLLDDANEHVGVLIVRWERRYGPLPQALGRGVQSAACAGILHGRWLRLRNTTCREKVLKVSHPCAKLERWWQNTCEGHTDHSRCSETLRDLAAYGRCDDIIGELAARDCEAEIKRLSSESGAP